MDARIIRVAIATLLPLVLIGCSNQPADDASAHADANRLVLDSTSAALARNYDQARAVRQWELAQFYAERLQRTAPNSVPAQEVQATMADTNIHADEARDKRRLAQLWAYGIEPASDLGDGVVLSASIDADTDSDPDGFSPAHMVLLKTTKLARSVHLVLAHGAFDCSPGCIVSVGFDDQPTRGFAASMSPGNNSVLSIDDEEAIRDKLDKVRVIGIKTSIAGVPRLLRFEVGGFDRVSLERKN